MSQKKISGMTSKGVFGGPMVTSHASDKSLVMYRNQAVQHLTHEAQYSITPASKQRVHQGLKHMLENLISFTNLTFLNSSPTVKSFVDNGNNGLDGVIPRKILQNAKGFAIFTIFKAGFIFSARAGSGIVIAKLENGCM